MKAAIGRFMQNCIRAHMDKIEPQEIGRSPLRHRRLEDRVEGNMPSLVAFRIENGFLVDTQSGMRFCKDANEIAEAIVVAETKQKIGLKDPRVLREASQTLASNGGF